VGRALHLLAEIAAGLEAENDPDADQAGGEQGSDLVV
jgi:hypothetical protein